VIRATAREGRTLAAFGTVAVLALAATVLLTQASLQVNDPLVRGAMEAIAGATALGATWLALLRSARTRLRSDLALACGLGLVAVNSSVLVLLTGLWAPSSGAAVAWLSVPARIAAGCLLLAGGLAVRERRRIDLAPAELVTVIVIGAVGLATAGAAYGALRGSATTGALPQIAAIVLFMAAATVVGARARRCGDRALWWYAGAIGALALTRLLFWQLPPKGPDWVSPGDGARMLVAVLLAAAVQSELSERRRAANARTLESERRRLAREFHDGLAQELAFIVSQSRRALAGQPDAESLEMVAAAGQTALLEARQAIFKLNRRRTTMLSTAIVEHTMRIANRAGLTLAVEVDGEVPVDREAEHEILRIVGEAVSNAAKHANASHVSVAISSERGRVIVRIADDGEGFDPASQRARRGFGLTSMSERTRSLGGRLHLESTPGAGTVIEVAI
jgi:signal transduction histidine kinase